MTPFVILIDSAPGLAQLQARLAGIRRELGLDLLTYTDVNEAVAALRTLPNDRGVPSFVLLGSSLSKPVWAARKVHAASPHSYLIFVRSGSGVDTLKEHLGPFTLLGADWSIADSSSGELVNVLRDVHRSVRQRHRLRQTLDQINIQLGERGTSVPAHDRHTVTHRFLASVLEHAHDAIIAMDEDGRVKTWNAAADQLFGISEHEALGNPLASMAGAEWASALPGLLAQLRNGQSHHVNAGVCLLRADDARRFVDLVLTPIRDFSGGWIGATAIIRDVTEAKAAEDALRDSETRMRTIMDRSPAVIYVLDLEHRYRFANRQWEAVTGYSRDEVVGKTLEDVWPPDTARQLNESSRAAFEAGGPTIHEEHIPQADGIRVFLSQKFPLVDSSGVTYALCGMSTDISERKQLEEALQGMNRVLEARVQTRTADLAKSNEALEHSNLQLQRFAYIASHDLQAPLRTIAGFAQLLRDEYGSRLDAQADDWIDRVVGGAERMQSLIEDILTYSRLDASAAPFERVDLNAICDDVVASLDEAIRGTSATVTRDDLPVVLGDRAQLTQVLQNLIDNALKYRGPTPPSIRVGAEVQDATDVISVHDNGVGVEPAYAETIFEVFRRLHPHRTHPGTGIGLAICRTVIRRHEGRIWVESNSEGGSTFRFTLPRAQEPLHG